MKIPSDAIIPEEKLTQYLLLPRDYDDKSKFLALAEFTQENPDLLFRAIQELIAQYEAIADGQNEYGDFFRVEGALIGPNGYLLHVVTIWLRWKKDGLFRFVTLKPLKERRYEN